MFSNLIAVLKHDYYLATHHKQTAKDIEIIKRNPRVMIMLNGDYTPVRLIPLDLGNLWYCLTGEDGIRIYVRLFRGWVFSIDLGISLYRGVFDN